jgi:hypothetical protein
MILKTFTEPTNVLIIGAYIEGYDSSMITDDFTSFTTRIGNNEIESESDGFFTILTEDDFYNFLTNEKVENPYEDGGIYEDSFKILLKNYVGNIEAKVFDYDDQTIEYEILDTNEIIYSITSANDLEDSPNFFLISDNSEYKEFDSEEFEEYCKITIISHNREKKINEILK